MKAHPLVVFLTVVSVAACADRLSAPESVAAAVHKASFAAAPGDTSTFVVTPNGYYYRNCVYVLGAGEAFGPNGTVNTAHGVKHVLAGCTHPGPVAGSGAAASSPGVTGTTTAASTIPPGYNGWAESYQWNDSTTTLRHMSARFVVPILPANAYANTYALMYWFPGMQNGYAVVQPVLQYGDNGTWGGAYWTIASWICGAVCEASGHTTVNVGDVLGGTIDASNCVAQLCQWDIKTADSTSGITEWLSVPRDWDSTYRETLDRYTNADGGVLELHNLGGCNDLSGGEHEFSQLVFKDSTGTTITHQWHGPIVDPNASPSCGYSGTIKSYTDVVLTDSLAPLLGVYIGGPTYVVDGGS